MAADIAQALPAPGTRAAIFFVPDGACIDPVGPFLICLASALRGPFLVIMSLRLFNSLTRSVEPFVPLREGHVGIYVCGITVYDLSHVGHARMMVAFDTVVRWLRASGYTVTHVRNITDIDDKIIRRAVERGITIKALTDEMIDAMHEDFGKLGLSEPTHEPRATQFIPQMLDLVGRLKQQGLAYAAPSGDMLYAVRRFPGYGKLSGKSLDDLRAGERVAVADEKADPLDFVLWKSAKPDEPAEVRWESPYGAGRPGWHLECSAMGMSLLGETFDMHGGGLDLQFPHHENEIAQSEGATGKPFVRYWLHNGFVNIDDEKMSKSLGNFFTVREVLERYDAQVLRFLMLRTHYRSPFNFSDAHLDDAQAGLRRLYGALAVVPPGDAGDALAIDWSTPAATRFRAAMDDDFNTPEALAVLFDLAGVVHRASEPHARLAAAQELRALGSVLGILQGDANAFLRAGVSLDEARIDALVEERAKAKAGRDFARADAIRDELLAAGVQLKDSAQGTTWVRR